MARPRILRFLRIAVSAAFGILCLLLIPLWVRSYWWRDEIIGHISETRLVECNSVSGTLALGTSVWPSLPPPYTDYVPWKVGSFRVDEEGETWFAGERLNSNWEFYLAVPPNQESAVFAPHWFLVLLAAALAIAPWIKELKWRFSLRTLLLAMTLVAIVLGLAMALR
jgi:hypothetical protein